MGRGVSIGLALMAMQGGTVAAQASPMGQGEAAIAIRSDVKLQLEGKDGTSTARVEQMGKAVNVQMRRVRACYRELVAKRPTTVGAFRVTIDLDKGKDTALAIEEQGGSDPELKHCVLGVLGKAGYETVERPATAVVTFAFDNSRAQGQAELMERKAEQDQVDVTVDASGKPSARWTSGDGRVGFLVTAKGPHAEASIQVALRGLRDGFATFLDCRRRAEKDGLSPEGDIDLTLRLPRRPGKAKAKLDAITVPHERVPRCIDRAFRRTDFDGAPPSATAHVTIQFRK